MTKYDGILKKKNPTTIEMDQRTLSEIPEEELEQILEEMTKEGYLKKSEKGYSLTNKGKIRGRLSQMIDFFK